MNLRDITLMTKRASTLNALQACKGNEPLKWRKAWRAAQQDPNVTMPALSWLNDQARREAGFKDVVE